MVRHFMKKYVYLNIEMLSLTDVSIKKHALPSNLDIPQVYQRMMALLCERGVFSLFVLFKRVLTFALREHGSAIGLNMNEGYYNCKIKVSVELD